MDSIKYTFQDSTEFPVQRDFIQDLQDFLGVSEEVIPLERSAIRTKEENRAGTAILEKRIREIDEFQIEVTGYLEKLTQEVDSEDILEIKNKILETCDAAASGKKDENLEELEKETRIARNEIQQLETKILSILSPFFEAGIYGAKHAYSAAVEGKKLTGMQVSSIDSIQYEYDLTFAEDMIKVGDLHEFTLPIWVKAGILHKEDKIKKLDVSDFHIMSIEYEGNSLSTVFEDKDGEHRITISADEMSYLILHGDYEISGDEKLAASIDMDAFYELTKKLKQFFKVSVESRKLRRVLLEGKNVMDENRVQDSLKLIAGIYGKLIGECVERGYTKGEISIKIEEPGGIRTEKYLSSSELLSRLSDIGSEGLELAGILGITET
ncbi:hypothetical protein MSMTP_1122 [Methanosarcina sp. MTP4]|uniref:hypothetical protein n=1 Tax=Methanosarcina sp. MTP4 TaxID=1434100 RepID=UPI00061611D9|nr:hypothetical protein [Methanosarcina sp. MTP4]AKB24591.1 hypothetical protein MSMTP_1122 [Methanosarcina sp. MTP4]